MPREKIRRMFYRLVIEGGAEWNQSTCACAWDGPPSTMPEVRDAIKQALVFSFGPAEVNHYTTEAPREGRILWTFADSSVAVFSYQEKEVA
jgi:hypothetical protein